MNFKNNTLYIKTTPKLFLQHVQMYINNSSYLDLYKTIYCLVVLLPFGSYYFTLIPMIKYTVAINTKDPTTRIQSLGSLLLGVVAISVCYLAFIKYYFLFVFVYECQIICSTHTFFKVAAFTPDLFNHFS